jgi:GntR family transcriptional regulator of arabinose operon
MQNQPLYQRIYEYLLEGIQAGRYSSDERLPSEKELADQFNVSRITSKRALELLAKSGVIKRMPGKGSFIVGDNCVRSAVREDEPAGKDRKRNLVGVVVADFSESYGTGLLSGIELEASLNGCFIIPRRSYGKQSLEEEIIDELLDFGVEGIIIMPVHGECYNQRIIKLVLDKFPIVLLDRNLRGIPTAFVGSDNVAAAKKMTDYLLESGHRSISFLSVPPVNTSAIEDRIEGFVKSHAEHGIQIDESIWLPSITGSLPEKKASEHIAEDIVRIRQLLIEKPSITCLFASEYNIALMALEAVRSLGYAVPEDISIVCFDGPRSMFGDYFFTHIRQDETKMGSLALKLLKESIDTSAKSDKIYIDTELIHGKSVKKIQ